MSSSLAERLADDGYDGYSYAYPHKTAYRPLDPPVPLEQAWRLEDKRHVFLYVHLPFCEMRCGFCNLFTTVHPGSDLVDETLAAINRQSEIVAGAVKPGGIAQAAFGGGTPSFLSERQIEQLFVGFQQKWPVKWPDIPVSFEVSPATVSREKLALLKSLGVDRVSLGVQSFVVEDLISLKRPQRAAEVEQACHEIKATGFAVFNMDLIYGNEGQDAARWRRTIDAALEWQPEELYLYPLYIRTLTNLDRSGKRPSEHRRTLYRLARECLLAAGYRQVSMRLFRRTDVIRATDYCCQDDGMVGLGPGARSYTRSLHYSTEYAVGQPGVRKIIEDFNTRDAARHVSADYGVTLDDSEQKRRYVIKSLLRVDGLSYASYVRRFGRAATDDFPKLLELVGLGLAVQDEDRLRLTDEGIARTDTIGPWLYSEAMTALMSTYQLV